MIQNRVADPISPERSARLTQTQKKSFLAFRVSLSLGGQLKFSARRWVLALPVDFTL